MENREGGGGGWWRKGAKEENIINEMGFNVHLFDMVLGYIYFRSCHFPAVLNDKIQVKTRQNQLLSELSVQFTLNILDIDCTTSQKTKTKIVHQFDEHALEILMPITF